MTMFTANKLTKFGLVTAAAGMMVAAPLMANAGVTGNIGVFSDYVLRGIDKGGTEGNGPVLQGGFGARTWVMPTPEKPAPASRTTSTRAGAVPAAISATASVSFNITTCMSPIPTAWRSLHLSATVLSASVSNISPTTWPGETPVISIGPWVTAPRCLLTSA
jgi:hypothetical protein